MKKGKKKRRKERKKEERNKERITNNEFKYKRERIYSPNSV